MNDLPNHRRGRPSLRPHPQNRGYNNVCTKSALQLGSPLPLRSGPSSPVPRSAKPGRERLLDRLHAAGRFDPSALSAALDNDDCRDRADAEALDDLGMVLDENADELERVVVPASLEDLGQVGVDVSRAAGGLAVEVDEPRPCVRARWPRGRRSRSAARGGGSLRSPCIPRAYSISVVRETSVAGRVAR